MSESGYRIGQRPARPANKKGRLGAQKVAVDFSQLEKEAQDRYEAKPASPTGEELSPEDKAKNYESMQAAYEDLGEKKKREEEKLRTIDPKKAEQMERLGMGWGNSSTSSVSSKRPNLSHSATMDMKPIEQINPVSKSSRSHEADLENDFMALDLGLGYSASSKYESSSMRSTSKSSREADSDAFWDSFDLDTKPAEKKPAVIETIESIDMHGPSSRSQKSESTFKSSYSSNKYAPSNSAASSSNSSSSRGEAVQKFASAKAISSDQYFGTSRDSEYESKTQLSRFQGQNAISSDDYFGREKPQPSRLSMISNSDFPNVYEIKEGIRDGVTKVAGRLSSFATDVMSSLQDK